MPFFLHLVLRYQLCLSFLISLHVFAAPSHTKASGSTWWREQRVFQGGFPPASPVVLGPQLNFSTYTPSVRSFPPFFVLHLILYIPDHFFPFSEPTFFPPLNLFLLFGLLPSKKTLISHWSQLCCIHTHMLLGAELSYSSLTPLPKFN